MDVPNPYAAPEKVNLIAEPALQTRIPLRFRVAVAFSSTASVATLASFNPQFLVGGQALILAVAVVIAVSLIPQGCGKYDPHLVLWIPLLSAIVGLRMWWAYYPGINPLERVPALVLWILLGLIVGLALACVYMLLRYISDSVRRWTHSKIAARASD